MCLSAEVHGLVRELDNPEIENKTIVSWREKKTRYKPHQGEESMCKAMWMHVQFRGFEFLKELN